MVVVRELRQHDCEEIVRNNKQLGWHKPASLYDNYLEEIASGRRAAFVGLMSEAIAGYLTIRWESAYRRFREDGIPEISDFNVFPSFRRLGVGTALMDAAEGLVATRSTTCGIGFGLGPNYGAAQRLYVLRGYVPDAHGAQYGDRDVIPYETLPLDDELVIFLTKDLTTGTPSTRSL